MKKTVKRTICQKYFSKQKEHNVVPHFQISEIPFKILVKYEECGFWANIRPL
jgi:hypothetical protein